MHQIRQNACNATPSLANDIKYLQSYTKCIELDKMPAMPFQMSLMILIHVKPCQMSLMQNACNANVYCNFKFPSSHPKSLHPVIT